MAESPSYNPDAPEDRPDSNSRRPRGTVEVCRGVEQFGSSPGS